MLGAAALAIAAACGAPAGPSTPPKASAERPREAAPPGPKECDEREALFDGGSLLRTDDGVALWHKAAGDARGPTIAYLHGGPCFGSLDFEKSAGPVLEKSARMVYFDQRGCGRSITGATEANLNMAATVEDLERLRRHFGLGRLHLVAHSAGGWVAVEYAKKHPERLGRLVLVDTSGAFQRSVQYRLDYAASTAPRAFPEHAARARELAERGGSSGPAARLARFDELAELLGGPAWFRSLYYASDREERCVDRWSTELRRHCNGHLMGTWYGQSGYTLSDHPELMVPLPAPALLLAGRQSHVFGPELLEEAAAAWNAELRWLEGAGHFPFAAQPERFAEAVLAFVNAGGPGR